MKKFSFLVFCALFVFSCQVETTPSNEQNNNVTENNNTTQNTNKDKVVPTVAPTVSPSPQVSVKPTPIPTPPSLLTGEKDVEDKDVESKLEKDPTSTDAQTIKTNIDWKLYNPITKGKKYTYNYTVKEGTFEFKADVLWEISEVSQTGYVLKRSILSDKSQLSALSVPVALNSDNSPSIVPVVSVGGEKVETTRNIEVFDKIEKVKLPYKELDTIKVISKTTSAKGEVKTTNWYSKGIGLVKSVQESTAGVYTLELKDFM
ncbi:MAG: hypothetical protein AABZ74_13355 [Cyanobacteriota bacterium]